jgi:hypothetical protein
VIVIRHGRTNESPSFPRDESQTSLANCSGQNHVDGSGPATNTAVVKATMRGPRRVRLAKKAPATATLAQHVTDVMPDDSLKRRRDRAMVMLGFAGAFRKSEVVGLDVEDLEFCDEGVTISIRRSKTDQEGKAPSRCCAAPVRSARSSCCGNGWTKPALLRVRCSGR